MTGRETAAVTDEVSRQNDRLSVRPVIEHALTDYGYSPDTVQTLLDRLAAEARAD